MKSSKFFRQWQWTWVTVFVVTTILAPMAAGADVTVQLTATNRAFPYVLRFDSTEAALFLVQQSDDGLHWTPYINVYATITSGRLVDRSHDIGAPLPAMQLYTVTGAVQSPSDMLQRWEALGYSRYSFSLNTTYTISNPGIRLTVAFGKVVSAQATRPDGSVVDVDPTSYPSIEQIFRQIVAGINVNQLMTVRYDTERFFPVWAFLDEDVQWVDDEQMYYVSDVVQLPN